MKSFEVVEGTPPFLLVRSLLQLRQYRSPTKNLEVSIMSRTLRILKIALGTLGCWLIFYLAPVLGAERIVFYFRRVRLDNIIDPIYISDLETKANRRTGLENLLTTPYNSKGSKEQTLVELRRLIKYLEKEGILELFEEVIQTKSRSRVDSAKAIKSAIILTAANDSRNFTALEVLRNFPTNDIIFDVDPSKLIKLNSNLVSKMKRSLEIARANNDSLEEGLTLLELGWFYGGMGKPHKAIKRSKLALEIFEKEEVDFNAGKALTLTSLGFAYNQLDEDETALMYYQKAQEIYQNREPNSGLLSAPRNSNFSLPEVVQLIDQYAGEEILDKLIQMVALKL